MRARSCTRWRAGLPQQRMHARRCSRSRARTSRRARSTRAPASWRSTSTTTGCSLTATEWVASLSPWPEEFGLGRMHALLDALGNPQRAFPLVHVVGTNGKSTATRTIAALLRARRSRRRRVHVAARERLARAPRHGPRLVRARGRARPSGGRGGRRDAVRGAHRGRVRRLRRARRRRSRRRSGARRQARRDERPRRSRRPADERRPRAHRRPRRHARGDRAREARRRRARTRPSCCPTTSGASCVPDAHASSSAARARRPRRSSATRSTAQVEVSLPGRLERRGPDEVRDGAHTPEAVEWLLARLEPREWTIVASILRDKDVDAMLERLAAAGPSTHRDARAATRARSASGSSPPAPNRTSSMSKRSPIPPTPSRGRARSALSSSPGSLYLLADLHDSR